MPGELGLVGAVLARAVADLTSANAEHRAAAVAFLHDEELVELWTSLVGIDREAWEAHAQQALQRR